MNIVSPDFGQLRPDIIRNNVKEMLTVSRIGQQTTVKINSSSLGIMLSCPRKSYYVLERGLRSKSESPALLFGTAIHKALEVFYSHPLHARTIPHNFAAHTDKMVAGTPAPDDHFLYKAMQAFIDVASPLSMLPDSDKRSVANGVWTLQHYFNTYINDVYTVYSDANGPVTERRCEVEIYEDPGLKIIVHGTIDVVLKDEVRGVVLPGDHKTTSQLGSTFFDRCKPNHQYSGYILLAQKVLGIETNEFLINALQVKPRPSTARGTPPHFARQVTVRSDEDMDEFREAVIWAARSYLFWREANVWPLGHADACSSFGGCTFISVCSSPGLIRENIIESKFVGDTHAST